ncbi:patatin-like phospholipase family protein [Kingella kingae]|uniref:patatin-like phospholipase family protein n=1 Tax=Kingella kingae TaxID=504 RepID=UPI0004291835|nr:patatin-like phospholipase family protein [Kingella kingae]MDK4624111.1 patatin-like phospholipase family protein [Kingella kingae]MDK4659705.1 patatin-like phospholipase family protein [Kingella kingae]MDK4667697.1 patatin-like phospholipase family protein [Kingella kingae]MDK4686059.1 patatin-like phospholipase family protein [Kingella kingae]
MRFTRRVFLLSAASILLTSCSVIQSQSTASQNTNQPRLVVGLALGGGASKGFAHIGVLKVLRENNIPVHVVTGTSAGALVGSLYASGMQPARLQTEASLLEKGDIVDLTLSTRGFIRGEKLQNWVNDKVGNRTLEKLPIKFAAVATEFGTGKMVVFNRGNTGQAVRASASIPNVFQPVEIGGKQYVDGGLSAPVPVSAAKRMGANVVIAVDISAKPARLEQSSGFFAYLDQSLNIMSISALNTELAQANVVIKPAVQQLGAVGGFDQKAQAIALGEQAARAALPKIKAELAKYR